jgi:peptidoglycan/LPS O-acetylase OafA/YrhL
MRYRTEIDGLRTVAVIPVILFHLGFKWIDGGYIGVDVFFVISGFLITAIILREFEKDRFSFGGFWSRRVRRIIPALAVMLGATLLVVSQFSFRGDSTSYGLQGAAAMLSFSNIALWRATGNYWGADAQNSPFLHTWSLSVEEQFYLVYPLFIILMLRHARRWVVPALLTVTVASFFLYVLGSHYRPTATFYLLPTRAWELGCGGLLAFWRSRTPGDREVVAGRLAEVMATLGLVAVVASYLIFSGDNSFPGHLAIPVVGSSLFIGLANSNTGVGRLLSLRPLVSIGKMSYSLYLWHWPVIVLIPTCFPRETWATRADFMLPLMACLAFLSYRLVENPTRHASLKSKRFLCIIAIILLNLFMCWHIRNRSPFYEISDFEPVVWEGESYVSAPNDAWAAWGEEMTKGILTTPRNPNADTAWQHGGIIKKHGGDVPEIVVLGDSHALMWAGTIDRIAAKLKRTVSFYAAHGTSAFVNIPVRWNSATASFNAEQRYLYDVKRVEFLTRWKPKVVVMSMLWPRFARKPPPLDLIELLGSNGATVILIQQPPKLGSGDRNQVQYLSYLRMQPENHEKQYVKSTTQDTKYHAGQAYVRELCKKYPFCHAVEVEETFRDARTGDVWVLDGRTVLYTDDDHLSQSGAEKLRPQIEQAIKDALTADGTDK